MDEAKDVIRALNSVIGNARSKKLKKVILKDQMTDERDLSWKREFLGL